MNLNGSTSALFLANNLALDFINTSYGSGSGYCDCFTDDESVVVWLKQADQLPAESLIKIPTGLVQKAKGLRNCARKIVRSASENQPDDLNLVNEILNFGWPEQKLEWDEKQKQYIFTQYRRSDEVDSLLYPVVAALVQLLCSSELKYVRQCEAHDCTLMFLDTTKSHRRRWCSMALCGNRMKVAAHRKREKK
ncbi:CGNR zinc finger domain-containing protein [Vibrio salinus]|uniref:CGNR zinc finger domain-containing protein n=1 Tax=Vibrio salinus TaxID=2899784 RepID=UPI001E3CAE9C|nr:CGNR zinc finger domain-containing protein [Vibrio salinus]MCE0494750.1 CGNR zinc finger domain-containing protein [Vibrio salinus]